MEHTACVLEPKFHLARHVSTRHVRRAELVVSSRAVWQARHSQNAWARHVERVESCRHVTWRAEWNSGFTTPIHGALIWSFSCPKIPFLITQCVVGKTSWTIFISVCRSMWWCSGGFKGKGAVGAAAPYWLRIFCNKAPFRIQKAHIVPCADKWRPGWYNVPSHFKISGSATVMVDHVYERLPVLCGWTLFHFRYYF